MKFQRQNAFTLIEMMVSIVVGGILLASLVSMSGSVQRSFARNKDVTSLQANLRFSMLRLVSDLKRSAYMYTANPELAALHYAGPPLDSSWRTSDTWNAIEYDPGSKHLTIRANFSSSRDYYLEFRGIDQGRIMCRNKHSYNPEVAQPCGPPFPASVTYLEPFADGMPFERLFQTKRMFRLLVKESSYSYHRITWASPDKLEFGFEPAIDRHKHQLGNGNWVSPISDVQYHVIEKPVSSGRWVLERTALNTSEVAEFLLPPTDNADTSGFWLRAYNDTSHLAKYDSKPWTPEISAPKDVLSAADIDPLHLRALEITIRGRAETEDPDFVIPEYDTDPAALDYGFDLDGNPDNGLARVRVERTVVQLKNMAMSLTL